MGYKSLNIENVECLISWPKGTVGYEGERETLKTLISLCDEHGYGRIPQLCRSIEKIWRDPNSISDFEKERKEYLELIERDKKEYIESLEE